MKSSSGSTDSINLQIHPLGGDVEHIDAEPLGQTRFYKMFADMERFTIKENEVMTAKKVDN